MQHKSVIGFSLIELMVVVAIIAILAATAIPSYKTYTEKARFSEVIAQTEPFKLAISLALQEGTPIDEINDETLGIPLPTTPLKNLESIHVSQGMITAKATVIAGDATITLTPDENGTQWKIGGSCLNKGLCHD